MLRLEISRAENGWILVCERMHGKEIKKLYTDVTKLKRDFPGLVTLMTQDDLKVQEEDLAFDEYQINNQEEKQ